MLGTFPRVFSQVATSQMCIFPSGNFPNVHFPSWGKCRFSYMGKLPLGKLSFGKMYIWEVAAWETAHLGSCNLGNCHLGSCPWENAFGKVPYTDFYSLIDVFSFLLLIPFYCCGLALQLKVQSVSRNKTVDRRLKGVLTIHFCMYYLSFGKNNQNFLYPGIFKLWPAIFVLLK